MNDVSEVRNYSNGERAAWRYQILDHISRPLLDGCGRQNEGGDGEGQISSALTTKWIITKSVVGILSNGAALLICPSDITEEGGPIRSWCVKYNVEVQEIRP